VPRPPLYARRRQVLPAGSAAVGGPGAAPPRRRDRYLPMFGGGADDLAGRRCGARLSNSRELLISAKGTTPDGSPFVVIQSARHLGGIAISQLPRHVCRHEPHLTVQLDQPDVAREYPGDGDGAPAAIEKYKKLKAAWLDLERARDEELRAVKQRNVDPASDAAENAAWEMARTKPSTAAGASAMLSFMATEPTTGLFELGETHWHERAFRTVVASLVAPIAAGRLIRSRKGAPPVPPAVFFVPRYAKSSGEGESSALLRCAVNRDAVA
jgi:hypothetical protein